MTREHRMKDGGDLRLVWEGVKDFGNGERRYRCVDISSQIGESIFQYYNATFGGWREVNNHNTRFAMHSYISQTCREPF